MPYKARSTDPYEARQQVLTELIQAQDDLNYWREQLALLNTHPERFPAENLATLRYQAFNYFICAELNHSDLTEELLRYPPTHRSGQL